MILFPCYEKLVAQGEGVQPHTRGRKLGVTCLRDSTESHAREASEAVTLWERFWRQSGTEHLKIGVKRFPQSTCLSSVLQCSAGTATLWKPVPHPIHVAPSRLLGARSGARVRAH